MSLLLRFMANDDITQVLTIDRASFVPPWPARSYLHEINESQVSHMSVLERCEAVPVRGWRRMVSQLRGNEMPTTTRRRVVGYGGLWRIAEEAHISTIASHPEHRGQRYGEIVLAGMIRRAIRLGAAYVVLEVRVSNTVAQQLYRKYDFEVVERRVGYYHNDNEDAYAMRLNLDDPAGLVRFDARYQQLQQAQPFNDHYSHSEHPRQDRDAM